MAEGCTWLREPCACRGKEREGGRRGWTGAGVLQISAQVRRGGEGSSLGCPSIPFLPHAPKDQNG